jgi:hypothetical protein
MQIRVLFSIVNVAVFLTLFALEFTFTAYSNLIFYVLLAWFIGSFLILRLPFMSRRIGRSAPRPVPGGTPLPSGSTAGGSGVDAAEIGFCPHCGTHVPPGTPVCPSCGKSTRLE